MIETPCDKNFLTLILYLIVEHLKYLFLQSETKSNAYNFYYLTLYKDIIIAYHLKNYPVRWGKEIKT